jgi:uncharacterized protein (TIGR02145 family)/uncharacterized repeat protein (TIGR02543 family)
VVVFAMLHLYCQLFDPPTAPEKTDVSAIFKASNGQIYKGSLIDSVGKVVEIGAALYLPDNFDSLSIRILDGSSTIMDTTFHAFKVGYFYDTIWVRNTFWTPGGKNVMITPYSRPARLPIIETITIQGVSQNTPPQWSVDTLKKTIKVGTPIFQALSDICTDTELDRITYALLPGAPDCDTIIGSAYQFNPTVQNVGTFVVQIKASDPAGSFSILPFKIIVENGSEDKQPPEVTFVTPSDTNTTVTVDSFTIDLLCTDASGVASVSAALGTTTIQSNLKNGHFLILIKGFTKETMNIVTITATDSTAAGNTNTRKLYFNYTTSTPPFTVTYNGNTNTAGAPPVDPGKYEIGAIVTVKDNTGNMVKAGYTFIGWNTAADGSGAVYVSGATFPMGSANVTLYAQWTTKPIFIVTYDGNGNTGGTVPADANKYETAAVVTVKDNTGLLIKSGSTFAGWNTKADGSGTAYSSGVTFPMGNVNITFYAQWTVKPTFTVTYDGNGNASGTVPADSNKYETAANVTVKENIGLLVKTGLTFAGWNSKADGSGTSYAAGVSFPMGNANVTLYAQWTTKPTFTVTYDGNGNTGGIVPADGNKYETAAIVTVKENTGLLIKSGSTFAGWNTAVDESGTAYATGVTFPMGSANVILYAQWTLKPTFTVTYDGNGNTGGTVPVDANKYETSATIIVKDNIGLLVKTGYIFSGWNTLTNGIWTSYKVSDTLIKKAKNDTLYAQWRSYTYTVLFDGQNVITNSTKEVTSPKTTVETLPSATAVGYQFGGWYTGINGGGSPFLATTVVTENITVFAKWTRVFKVTYDANGGTGTVPIDPNAYQNSNTIMVLSGSTLTRANYTFAGWNTQADTLGSNYTGGGQFTIGSADVILYAKWRMNAPNITTQLTNKTCPVNDSVTFTIAATGANLSYTWQKNGETITGATGVSYTTSRLTADDMPSARTYKCVVTNPGGSVNSSATLSISTLTDIDSNVYHLVRIGSQIWTVENLRVTRYSDGTVIWKETALDLWRAVQMPMYCFYENTTDQENIRKFGALYNWFVVDPANSKKVAPVGWHVPSDAEWTVLENYLISNRYNWDGTNAGNKIAKAMAAKSDWVASSSSPNEGDVGNGLISNNKSNFSALPGGYRSSSDYMFQTTAALWWSTTECDTTSVWGRMIGMFGFEQSELSRYNWGKSGNGFSVRLVKD